jgi:hypothetical protein
VKLLSLSLSLSLEQLVLLQTHCGALLFAFALGL